MRIEHQVCTYEQAIKLKNLGVVQASLHWSAVGDPDRIFSKLNPDNIGAGKDYGEVASISQQYRNTNCIARFTAAELGTMLPRQPLHSNWAQVETFWSLSSPLACCQIDHSSKEEVMPVVRFKAETEAQARAEMLIYLLENRKVSVKEINTRLVHEDAATRC